MSVRPSVHISCKSNFFLVQNGFCLNLVLMHLYTVYNLMMCIKDDNPGSNYITGDNLTKSSCKRNSPFNG